MIFFYFLAGVGSGLKVSGNLYEFYANLDVFHVFCWFLGYFLRFFEFCFVLLPQMGIEKTLLLENFLVNK